MYCRHCGQQLSDVAQFCPACGKPVERKAKKEPREEIKEEPKKVEKKLVKEKPVKKKTVNINKKKAAIIAASVAVAAAIVFVVASFVLKPADIDVSLIDEEQNEYMMINVPSNYTFKVECSGASAQNVSNDIKVYTIEGAVAKAENSYSGRTVKIKAPQGGYEKGEVYTLDISGKGSFSNEEITAAKKVIFVIESENASKIEYKDGVKEVKDGDAVLTDNKLQIKGKYTEGEIILSDTNGDKIQEIYKLTNVKESNGKTVATYTDPEADEVYKDIDIFYYNDIDVKDIQVDEQELLGMLDEAGILDLFIESVYANEDVSDKTKKDIKEKLKVKVKIKEDGFKVSFAITVSIPKKSSGGQTRDKKLVKNKKYNASEELTIKFTLSDKMFYKNKKKIVTFNNELSLDADVEIAIKGVAKADLERELKGKVKKLAAVEGGKDAPNEFVVPVIPIKIPIYGPVYGKFYVNLKGELADTGQFNINLEQNITLVTGTIFSYKKLEVIKKYANINADMDLEIVAMLKLELFAGINTDIGVVVPLLISAGVEAEAGGYMDAEGCLIARDIPKKPTIDGYYDISVAVKAKVDFVVELFQKNEISIEIMEKKHPLWAQINSLRLKTTDLLDKYTIDDGGFQIGKICATYWNVIDGKEENENLGKYKIFVDDEECEVKDGYVKGNFSVGEHTIKVEWKKAGQKYTDKKKVNFTDVDLLGYFAEVCEIGNTYASINKRHNLRKELEVATDSFRVHYDSTGRWMYAFHATVEGMEEPSEAEIKDYDTCYRMSGMAKDMFGINSSMSRDEFAKATNTKPGYGNGIDLDTYMYAGYVDELRIPGSSSRYHMLIEIPEDDADITPESMVHIQLIQDESDNVIKHHHYYDVVKDW